MPIYIIGTSKQAQFQYVHVRKCLLKFVESAIKRLPFKETVLNDLVWLDPNERTPCVSTVRRLAQRFPCFICRLNDKNS